MPEMLPYLTFLLAGLAGSLHCLGMCGPILLVLMGGRIETAAEKENSVLNSRLLKLTLYHVGRLWTYMLLGVLAGLAGAGIKMNFERLADIHQWQRWVGLSMSALVILAALFMTGLLPQLFNKLFEQLPLMGQWRMPDVSSKLNTCTFKIFGGEGWFKQLVAMRHPAARLLLGAMMGFLPCGLVYSVLILAASLPTPLHAAGAMLLFGLGTLPALSSLIWSADWLKRMPKLNLFIRRHGTQLAGVALLLTGLWMGWRAWRLSPQKPCPGCQQDLSAVVQSVPDPGMIGGSYER